MSCARTLCAAVLACAGCVVDAGPPVPLPEGDLELFASTVHPVLAAHCGDPSCHGRSDRPLEVYSTGQHRSDPARVFLEEPISQDEVVRNARNVAAFALDATSPDECAVLRKPLARAAGGEWHEGGEIFPSRDDRDYRAVRAWLSSLRAPE